MLPPSEIVVPDYTLILPRKQLAITKSFESTANVNRPRWQALTAANANFHIAKWKPSCFVNKETRKWVRNASDERAAQEGYRYSERRGQFTVDWVTGNCILYEGDKAGQKMDIEDWQYEYFMQVFGWLMYSDHWGRWIRRFNEASVWIAKKNMKSPTLAATGMYLLCGDGEMGQKCYSLARDSNQAMIAHQHAIEMVLASKQAGEPLGQECSYNKTTGAIRHAPTRSVYKPVAGENVRSTEGFNGSTLVDETHVVDRKLIRRVKRAKISRSEPIHLEMSTAGDDPDGYGFSRFEQGLRHEAAETDRDYNPRFYFLNYSIPQDTKLEDLYEKDIVVKLGHHANPTMDRGIVYDEFLSDWQSSVGSVTELRDFAMYRLNLWLKSSESWVALRDWLDCERKYTLTQLMPYPCVAGLDLSKTLDMTALVLMFAVPDPIIGIRPHIWPWFWIPEPTARKYQNRVDLWKWEKKQLTIIKNSKTIQYKLIADKLRWCEANLDFRGCGYDPYNGDKLMALLEDQEGWSEEMMVPIAQNMGMMAPATAEVERLILNGELCHNSNPVLNWQMSHCQVVEDKNGNKRPTKPTKDDYRKIDGCVALVMSQFMFDEQRLASPDGDGSILLYNEENPPPKSARS